MMHGPTNIKLVSYIEHDKSVRVYDKRGAKEVIWTEEGEMA